MKRILIIYPHNSVEMYSGVNRYFNNLINYLVDRKFIIDQLGFLNFESKWLPNHRHSGIHTTFLFNYSKYFDLSQLITLEFWLRVVTVLLHGRNYVGNLPRYTPPSLKKFYKEILLSAQYDYILISYVYFADLLDVVPLKNVKFVLDVSDLITVQLAERYNHNINYKSVLNDEIKQVQKFDIINCISTTEYKLFSRAMSPQSKIYYTPVLFELPKMRVKDMTFDLMFIGSDNVHNISGLKWFITYVLPLIKQQVKLLVVGKVADHVTLNTESITCIRHLDDLSDAYSTSKIVISPIFSGSGIKIKVLEALAYGKPLIATNKSIEGLPKRIIKAAVICENPISFARAITILLASDSLRNVYKTRSRNYILKYHSKDIVYSKMDRIFYD